MSAPHRDWYQACRPVQTAAATIRRSSSPFAAVAFALAGSTTGCLEEDLGAGPGPGGKADDVSATEVATTFRCELRVHTGSSQKSELVERPTEDGGTTTEPGTLAVTYLPEEAAGVERGLLDGQAIDIGGYRGEVNISKNPQPSGEVVTEVASVIYIPDADEVHGERAIAWNESTLDVTSWRTATIDWTGRFIDVEENDGACARPEDLVERAQAVSLACRRDPVVEEL